MVFWGGYGKRVGKEGCECGGQVIVEIFFFFQIFLGEGEVK